MLFVVAIIVLSYFFRYPYDEAATVALSTANEFSKDFKEVWYYSSPEHFNRIVFEFFNI